MPRKKAIIYEVWQEYSPAPHQQAFHDSDAVFRLMKGGYGSGKSFACCKEVMKLATQEGGNLIVVGRKHLTVLRETTMRTFDAALAPVRDKLLVEFNQTRQLYTLKAEDGGESQIQFMDMDDPQKLRSLEIGAFFVDEASEISEDVFVTLISRMRLKGVTRRAGILASNPAMKSHWLYKRFVENPGEDYAVFNSTAYDNPHLDPANIRAMEAAFDDERRKRFLHGEWGVNAEGRPVFPKFSRSRHVMALTPRQDQPLTVGWDFGFRRPAAVLAQMQDGALAVLDAVAGQDESLDAFADRVMLRIHELTPGREARHFGDVAGAGRNQVTGESCFGRLRARGIYVEGKAQRVEDGLMVLRARLEQLAGRTFGLIFAEDCHPLLLEAMEGGYHFGKITDAQGEDLPVKDGVYDHLADALRYLAVGLFGTAGTRSADWLDGVAAMLDEREGEERALGPRLWARGWGSGGWQ